MLVRNVALAFLGIVSGVAITFAVKIFLDSRGGNPAVSNPPSTVYNQQPGSFAALQQEKTDLLKRLKEVEIALNAKNPTKQLSAETATISQKQPALRSVLQASAPQAVPRIEQTRATSVVTTKVESVPLDPTCPYGFKVFVYPLPTSLLSIRISEEARLNRTLHVCQKCIFEQFSLEYIMYDFFSQFCGRTYNPEEADFFYLPIVRDAEYRMAMENRGPRARAPSMTEQALLNIMEKNNSEMWNSVFQYTDKYWHRRQGGDHLIVMPAPVTNLRHESSQRGYFHYMSHLHRPIFMGVEYSIQFVKDYPICATKKNIVVPYPTTDPDLFNGKLLNVQIERKFLLYYAGGMHGDCIETRRAMMVLMRNSTKLNGVIPRVRNGLAEREHGFLAATFCPIPIGDSPSSKRMYDVLNFGCIPVVLSDDLVWAFSDQTGGSMNHGDFAIQMPQSVVQFASTRSLRVYADRKDDFGVLPVSKLRLYDLLEKAQQSGVEYENGQYINPLVHILRQVPREDIDHLQQFGKIAAKNYRFYAMNVSMSDIPTAKHVLPDGGAMGQIADLLTQKKMFGIDKLSAECQYERKELKHTYQARYTCDNDKVDSLIANRKG